MSYNIISLADLKANARIEDSTEDTYLTSVCATAEQAILNLLDRSYTSLIAEYGAVPDPVKHAMLMYATHLYEHRGLTSPTALNNIPYTLDCLVKPYIKY